MSVATSELVRVFGRIGILSFGGPAAQIALMHRELVEKRAWLTEEQYLRALSFCMLLPGPEAMQLATYAGWRLDGTRGGLIAGLLFVLPGAAVVLALALAYAYLGDLPWMHALFLGIKAAVVVIVIEALLKVGKRALGSAAAWTIAGLAFLAIFVFNLPFPAIIILAAIAGAALLNQQSSKTPPTASEIRPGAILRTLAIWLMIWLVPLAIAWSIDPEFLGALGLFFSKLAVVTFGGAYAVLAYMTQAVAGDFGWLTTGEMMDALGLAETTPGPLILVTQFVGHIAGFREAGIGLAIVAGILTLWVTFVPCFLWIFAGAPFVDHIADRPRLSAALKGISSAVVGVILNLSLWFALHLFFRDLNLVQNILGLPSNLIVPDVTSLDWRAAVLSGMAAALLLRFHANLILVLTVCALGGLALSFLG